MWEDSEQRPEEKPEEQDESQETMQQAQEPMQPGRRKAPPEVAAQGDPNQTWIDAVNKNWTVVAVPPYHLQGVYLAVIQRGQVDIFWQSDVYLHLHCTPPCVPVMLYHCLHS